jgi:hypothetical protein
MTEPPFRYADDLFCTIGRQYLVVATGGAGTARPLGRLRAARQGNEE